MHDQLRPWLAASGADAVCLQEVTRTPGVAGWATFADGERTVLQRADLFGDVADTLVGYQGHFLTSDSGPVVAGDGRSWRQDFGIATFVHEQVPVVGTASAFVHGNYVAHAEWPAGDRPRVAHGVRLVDRGSGSVIVVVHMHGLRDPTGKGDTPARRAQAEQLAGLVSRIRAEADEVVVCGDLNLLPDSETFEVLAGIGLVDLVGWADTRTSRYTKPTRHANYLLVSDPRMVKHFEVVDAPEVSDHRALVVEVRPDGRP